MRSHSPILPSIAFSLLLMGMTSPLFAVTENHINPTTISSLSQKERKLEVAAVNSTLALQLFDRSIQIAQTIDDRATKIDTLSDIAVKLAEIGQTNRSRQLFDRAIRLTKQRDENFTLYQQEPAVRDIAIKMARSGFITNALQLNKTIASNYRQAEILNGIALILAEKGQLEPARKTLLEALAKAKGITGDYAYESNGSCGNDKFDILSKIAASLSLLSRFEEALKVAQSVTGCSSANGDSSEDYQAYAYLGILAHLANLEQVKQTWTSAQTMQNDSEKLQVWPKIGIKFAEMNQKNLALSVVSTISQKIPTVIQIDSGLAMRDFGAKENGLKDIAIKLAEKGEFESAKQIATTLYEPTAEDEKLNEEFGRIFKPSIKALTWVEITRQLAKAKQIQAALETANSIQDSDAKALAIIAIAQELQTAGITSQAEKILSQNLQLPAIPKPDDFNANQSYIKTLVSLAKVGQIERSLQLARSLPKDDSKQEALTNIAIQLAETGQLDRALQISNTLTLPGLKEQAIRQITSKYLATGQLDRALQISQQLEDDSKTDILAEIAIAFAKLGQTQKALQVAQTIASPQIKAIAIANIASNSIK